MKILSNQSTNTTKEVEINNIKVEILPAWERAKQIKNRIRAALADITIVLPTTQTPLIQHGDHADAVLRLCNMDTIKRTRKNDTINPKQNTSPNRAKKKRKCKKKTWPSRNEEDEGEDKANHRSSDEETAEGSSSNTFRDKDRDMSFMKDTDEEIDTGEIDEKDCIEKMKRNTSSAVDRMIKSKILCWIETHTRNEMALGNENCIVTR